MAVEKNTPRRDRHLAETLDMGTNGLLSDPGFDLEPLDDSGFPAEDDLLGQTLGQYRLEEVVGRGSMGRVYRAEHLGLGRPSALKVMNPGLVAKEPQLQERFWAEARAVAQLVHPHVVTVHNLGTDRGYHFIEMEYIAGGFSLNETLIRQGPFGPSRATELVRQVSLGLGAAHAAGLIHRDVKPANVLLTAEGAAKLADFGLVRHRGELRLAGVPIAGTPTFMAPELYMGVPASARSDLYAVGVMYFYLLSGMLPFASDRLGRLVQLHRNEPIPDIRQLVPSVPDVVVPIIERCLAKRPDRRYRSADELADDLQTVVYQLRDSEALVQEILEGLDCFVQGARTNYRVLFQLPGDRLQEVYLEFAQGAQGERLLLVFSVCGAAVPGYFESALKLNARLTHGSITIRNVDGQPMFVMTRTFLRDHVCAVDVRAAMLEIARRADRVEQQLSDSDLY